MKRVLISVDVTMITSLTWRKPRQKIHFRKRNMLMRYMYQCRLEQEDGYKNTLLGARRGQVPSGNDCSLFLLSPNQVFL